MEESQPVVKQAVEKQAGGGSGEMERLSGRESAMRVNSACLAHMDAHWSVASVACLLQKAEGLGLSADEVRKYETVLNDLLAVYPLSWTEPQLSVSGVDTSRINFPGVSHMVELEEEFTNYEQMVSGLAACLISAKQEGATSAERRPVAEWKLFWENRQKEIKAEVAERRAAARAALQAKSQSQSDTAAEQSQQSNAAETKAGEGEGEGANEAEGDEEGEEEMSVIENESLTALIQYAQGYYKVGDYNQALLRVRFYLDCVCDLVSDAFTDKKLRAQALWCAVTSLTLMLRPGAPDIEADISSSVAAVPQYILQLFELLTNASASQESNSTKALQACIPLYHYSFFLVLRCHLRNGVDGGSGGSGSGAAALAASGSQGWSDLLDFLLSERSRQLLTCLAPHLLRYVGAILIFTRKPEQVRSVANGLDSAAGKYSDEITRLVFALVRDYDFQTGQAELPRILDSLSADLFLAAAGPALMEHLRLLLFDNYCRVHKRIDLNMMAERLRLAPHVAEQWTAYLIEESKLDARIDSERNVIEINLPTPNFTKDIADKSKNLFYQAQSLMQSISS